MNPGRPSRRNPEQDAFEAEWRSGTDKAARWKTGRLCRQVAETLSLTLSECGEDFLLDLAVREVVPAPDAGRLLVTMEPGDPGQDPAAIVAALARAHGRLRSAVAAAVQRKRAPEIVFRLAPPEGGRP